VLIKEAQTVQGMSVSAARNMLIILEIEEVLTEFFFRGEVGGLVVILGQLLDGAYVGFLGPFG
jgi:hypothetical protein